MSANARHRIQRARFTCEPLLRRLMLAAGDPDLAFSSDGRAALTFSGGAFVVTDTAVAPDGKIVVGGTKGANLALARLNVDGSLDTSFGTGGLFQSNRRDELTSIAIQGDGKIVVGLGYESDYTHHDLMIGRILASGAGFDSGFGANGVAHAGLQRFWSSSVMDVAIQRDGKIIGAGHIDELDPVLLDFDDEFAVVRYDANGQLDPTFDGDGVSVHAMGTGEDQITAVTIDYNEPGSPLYGTIVAAGGEIGFSLSPSRFQVLRLRANGTGDSAFDGDGKLTSPGLSGAGIEYAQDVAVQPGGKVVVAGPARSPSVPDARNFLIARYTNTGALDTSFGLAGGGATELDLGGTRDEVGAIAVGYHNTLGNLIVAGSRNNEFAAVALRPNGQLDTRFSGDGIVTTTIPGHATGLFATGSLFAPARKLIFAGGSGQVARYVDVGSSITVGTFQPQMYEQGQQATSFVVARTVALPFAETIILGTSGTATTRGVNRDFNGTNILFGNGTTTSTEVVIPANATFTTVTLTPVDDALAEGDETIGFAVGTTVAYDAGTPGATTLVVRDNDTAGGPVVIASAFAYEPGPQRVRFAFSQNVAASIGDADFQLTGPAGTPSRAFGYDAVTNAATLSFNGVLPDGEYTVRAVAAGITNAAGQPMPADSVLSFFFLNGDANRDRRVNLQDFNILAANFGQSPRTFSQGDFNFNGIVNLQDFNILASRFGQALGPDGQTTSTGEARLPWPGAARFGEARSHVGSAASTADADDESLVPS